ncbi:DNA polymerase I [Arcobacter sp. 15-2]|uniref:DNA polymerase I n=1 Tax=Arcobacter sp. 15-2 TaxID=3374109 RepID=UPI00399C8765
MEEQKKTLTIIDTFGFLFRSYYALPPLKSATGFPTGMLTGFMNFISGIGRDFKTDYLVFALDSKGKTFRSDIYEEYKSHRPEAPEDLKAQLPVAIDFIEKMGFMTASEIGYEADDIIASLAHDGVANGLKIRIVSHDKDLYQLINDDICMFDPMKKKVVSSEECFTKYGVYPHQFTDYQSLLGDSADNVPGVKGVGAKTAMALIQQFDTLDNIYANIDNIEKPRWQKLLNENKEMAYISKQLVTLATDFHALEHLGSIEALELPKENPILKIADTLHEFGMNRIIDKVHKEGLNYKTTIPLGYDESQFQVKEKEVLNCEYILLNQSSKLFEVLNTIPKNSLVAFDTETTGIDAKKANIVGFSFCWENSKAYYVPIAHFYLGVEEQISLNDAKRAIELLNTHKLILQNFKYDLEVVQNNFGIDIKLYADTMIMAWLLDSDKPVGMDKLAIRLLDGYKTIAFKDVVKKGEDFSNVNIIDACAYAAEDAFITFKLYFKILEAFKVNDEEYLMKIATQVEFPFVNVLNNMENRGIKIDIAFFENLKEKSKNNLLELTQSIFTLAGVEFNINSPKQLGEVLFETLQLTASKKTKTGYSTNESVLQKIKDEHEVVPKILEYREAFKLHSTYIEPLLELAKQNDENKIYTSFLQTGTATGRLSSKNPNLQNIPVRTESGRAIREGFIASPGYKLVGIDYSQIELRLLAHYSKDPELVAAFRENKDIHLQTAIKIFGEDEAPNKRNIAKSINFGLLYGMGSRKLGEQLEIPSKEAKEYIDSYFKSFSTVKDFMKSIQENAMENGYVKTLSGRKRRFDFENATGMMKATYERESVNTVFQGSASDLIKLAMIKIDMKYKNNNDLKMLLQIHDELIFEVKEEKLDEITEKLTYIMENIYKLEVPLKVSLSIGNNWADLK